MRDGKLLAEAAPDVLLQRYHKNTLEDVFLELCRKNPSREDMTTSSFGDIATEEQQLLLTTEPQSMKAWSPPCFGWFDNFEAPSWHNVFALFWKNLTIIRFIRLLWYYFVVLI